MRDAHLNLPLSLLDVDAAIDQLLLPNPSQVSDAARYHFSAGGSRIRAQLGLAAAGALELSRQASLACAVAPELLHNASLVHDDLQDGDTIRRTQPAIWSRFGKDIAISTGDLLISAAYVALAQHPHPAAALRVMHDAIAFTIDGQTQDCRTKKPSPERYDIIAANKSGPLLALPIRLALIAADAPGQDTAVQAGHSLAIAYQTLDDIDDRSADLANDATNICLSLEALGHSQAAAQVIATARARVALKTARTAAQTLLDGVGVPFLDLADRLEIKLKDLNNATR
jgi:geranylgeranyl pyrophosphate synthase|tara:strand:- start:391 stop:1245 length:855 start_codon:yes stop_codon:yes gene_type:complete